MKKVITIIVIILIGSISLIGCKKDDKQANYNNDEGITENGNGSTDGTYEHTFPLTGLDTNDAVDNSIVSVMVNNHPTARPQSGLSKADIVYEILAEGHVTRFLALFHSEQPDAVGPVRSAREYYFELANGYDALYVYHGAADFINDKIVNHGVNHLNGSVHDNDGNLFTRKSFRKPPHNSYLLFPSVYDVAESKGYETTATIESLPFLSAEEQVAGDDDALQVDVTYTGTQPSNSVEYVYDGESKTYKRFADGEQTIELDTETPIEVDNVFIIETSHQVIDDEGRRAVDLASNGPAKLIQQGKQQEVEWENRDGQIIPVKNEKPVGFVPGKTWINVVPSIEQSVKITND